ncbi:hypothetical protein H6768_02835 [Candidatus Peribacteria bacterium]|nr:hypothetical protein [Candidatus Peribacteria bacterium]
MLGTNFTPRTITQQGVLEERKKLTELYSAALLSSHKNQAIKRIAICLPFWNVGKDTIFMPEITLLSKHWTVSPLCVSGRRYMVHMRP